MHQSQGSIPGISKRDDNFKIIVLTKSIHSRHLTLTDNNNSILQLYLFFFFTAYLKLYSEQTLDNITNLPQIYS